jgi:drug/metabolite transporter (DMT)-like permease
VELADKKNPGFAERRTRFLAIFLMCCAMVCFTGLDSSAKFLGRSLPTVEVVWVRYAIASLFTLIAARAYVKPAILVAKRPGLQFARSLLLLGSTVANFLALRKLQLAETSTIGFLQPMFVALMAGPLIGEKVGAARLVAIGVGFLGVLVATRPGTNTFQPIVLLAMSGVMCSAGYALITRTLARHDAPATTLAWTQLAGITLFTPLLPFQWTTPSSALLWTAMGTMGFCAAAGHGLLILAHQRAPAAVLTPFNYTQLIWMILSGWFVFGDAPPVATLFGAGLVVLCGLFLIVYERRASALATSEPAPSSTL